MFELTRRVTAANFDYGFECMRRGVGWSPGEPAESAEAARVAARRGVALEVVLHVYRGAHSVIWDIFAEEIPLLGLDDDAQAALLKATSNVQFDYFDHLITIATEAYTSELERLTRGSAQRRVEVVSRVLAGENASSDELGYRLEGHHLAMVVRGSRAESAARSIAAAMSHESLLVSRSDELAWLWLGGAKPFDDDAWGRLRAHPLPPGAAVAAGESQSAMEGFRLSHRQAQAAERASRRCGRPLVRYADVALLATVLEHETAHASFVAMFLGELAGPGSRNANLRETLQAYFSAGHNAASAAAALGVNERTVRNRLRTVERMLGHPVDARRPELEVALRIVDADGAIPPSS
jgi:hypothetical protein